MAGFETTDQGAEKPAVYTIGTAHTNSKDLQKIVSSLHIKHVFDIRGPGKLRGPPDLKPSNLAKSVEKIGSQYHDESKRLGDRNDNTFTLTNEFAVAMKSLAELAEGNNILVICRETDYRKCHRKVVASYLALKGFDVRHMGKGLSI